MLLLILKLQMMSIVMQRCTIWLTPSTPIPSMPTLSWLAVAISLENRGDLLAERLKPIKKEQKSCDKIAEQDTQAQAVQMKLTSLQEQEKKLTDSAQADELKAVQEKLAAANSELAAHHQQQPVRCSKGGGSGSHCGTIARAHRYLPILAHHAEHGLNESHDVPRLSLRFMIPNGNMWASTTFCLPDSMRYTWL